MVHIFAKTDRLDINTRSGDVLMSLFASKNGADAPSDVKGVRGGTSKRTNCNCNRCNYNFERCVIRDAPLALKQSNLHKLPKHQNSNQSIQHRQSTTRLRGHPGVFRRRYRVPFLITNMFWACFACLTLVFCHSSIFG